MSYNFDDLEYEWFKNEFYKLAKIELNKYKQDQMKRRISTYIFRRYKSNYKDFLNLIIKDSDEYHAFLEYLTINVSEFFRNGEQWDILKQEIFPILTSNNKGKLRIWSSACSSGEEPYSLAMIFTNMLANQDFEIIATDIDDKIMERAKNATYKLENYDKIPQEYRKWFVEKGDDIYTVAPEIRRKVRFDKLDLLKDDYPKEIDFLVCRNVLIYFIEDAKNEIYKKFSAAMVPGGVLFVGSSEQIVGSADYNLKAIKTYFYKKQ